MKPLLSVIIASYNHEKYVAKTIKSIESQTFSDFELIIIDDGSSDNTVKIINETTSITQVFTQKNQGVVNARNRGISLAKGKYLCFIDSDDIIMPDRFERQVSVLENNPDIGLVYAEALIIDSDGNELGKISDVYPVKNGDTAEMLILYYCFIPMITAMVRKEVLLKTGPFENPGPISDYIKWIEIAHLSKTYYDPKPLGCWRRHQESVSKKANQVKKYFTTRKTLKRTLRKYPELKTQIGKKINKRFSDTYFFSGFFLAANGNILKARKYYLKAFKINYLSMKNLIGVIFIFFPFKNLVVWGHKKIREIKLPW